MGLFCQSKEIYDPIRRKWVAATPEEIVRQKWVFFLTERLGYPKHAFAIEKTLSELCPKKNVPNRRIDLLCFETKSLKPLLLLECKMGPIQKKMLSQVMGYNAYLKAPFIGIVNEKEVLLQGNKIDIQEFPTYTDLKDACI